MSEISILNAPDWYRDNTQLFQGLSVVLQTTISSLLKSKKIDHLAVSVRVKSLESISEKLERKGYQKSEELTDIVGIRIITYIESDVAKVCDLLANTFKVHIEKSGDKSAELQINEIGYRSVHYICELGPDRIALPELEQYKNVLFEIQVRTVLQHAWAEIEHDRSYKFSGKLPAAIKRRLNLLAGTLEIVDREFDALAKEVDKHEAEAKVIAKSGKLSGVELTSAGLSELIMAIPGISEKEGFSGTNEHWPDAVFHELRMFGIDTLDKFSKLITEKFLATYEKYSSAHWKNGLGFVRAAMLFHDIDHYFESVSDRTWTWISHDSFELLAERYGSEKLTATLKKYGIKRLGKMHSTSTEAPVRKRASPKN